MEENNKEVKKEVEKNKDTLGIIVLIIAIILIGVGAGLLIVMPNENGFKKDKPNYNKETNTETNVNTETNNENNNESNTNNETNNETNTNKNVEFVSDGDVVSIEIDDSIYKLYNKYHSASDRVNTSGNYIENDIYSAEEFYVSSLNERIPADYAERIIKMTMAKVNSQNVTDVNEYTEQIFNNIEEEFKEFFGKNVKYDKSLFNCYEFRNTNEGINYFSNCGDTSPVNVSFTLTKAEKDNSHLYLYEEVELLDETNDEKTTYSYRWIFDLQEDGNYYFLKAEKVQ